MRIADLLRRKGSMVATVTPRTGVTELLARLAEHNVGALVVIDGTGAVAGIVSERDVVRRLHQHGPDLLSREVGDIMTTVVATCCPQDSVDELSALMTQRRIRHVPVLVDGTLAGIVSIGDVVKSRMDELEQNQEQLEAYIAGGQFHT
ncbi:CBS domain-containing protein [Saccharomonospora amisosensis]|uniref:CBS domain-containing protein n=1 Tax=Saccharomonospora amisosensis TaxID=1128677 RepID=A0A7X5UNG5_9PSEU|nr:CBS domain-containing protein [Saccharomonospora amisosensis]NIJ11256.1 CBS domain-containing protein [Saccharomonospora amisosensis]